MSDADKMSDLDKKLEEMLESEDAGLINEGIPSYDYQDMVAKIKQAFIDAGWSPTGSCLPNEQVNVIAERLKDIRADMTTGREFYDRFDKELKGKIFMYGAAENDKYVIAAVNECHSAARKAAGLEQ